MAEKTTEVNLKRDVVDVAVAIVKSELRVALPAVASAFNHLASRVTAMFRVRFLDTTRKPRDEPDAPDLPVMFPAGNGYGFWFDLADGDPMFAVAGDGPGRSFYESGQSVTPTILQGHDYGCAVAFPGGRVSSSEPGQETPPPNGQGEAVVGAADLSAALIFRRREGPAAVEEGTVVLAAAGPTASLLLGSTTAAVPPACAPQALANLADLNTRIQAWIPVPNDGGASLKPIIAAWFAALQDMADAKARLDGPPP